MARTKRRKTSLLRRGHYWLGLGLAMPLVVLAITGVLLNHTDDFNLDARYSSQTWLLNLYGIHPRAPETGYSLNGHWISSARNSLWLDAERLGANTSAPLVGATILDGLLVLAQPSQLRIYTQNGRDVERLDLPTQRTPISGITTLDGRLLLRGPTGTFSTSSNFTTWTDEAQPWPNTSPTPHKLPAVLQARIAQRLAGNTLTWEKILLDLHSGRIFGTWGPYFVDAVAGITVALAITGCLLWLRRNSRR